MFIQMPKLQGDMKQWLVQYTEAPPPHELRRQFLLGVLRAVARVHEFTLTHNDIKLDNILLTKFDRGGEAVLTDFEMCREDHGGSVSYTGTRVGGTAAYMAPERQDGMPNANKPTLPSDMYSVGVVLLLAFAPQYIHQVEARDAGARPRDVLQRVNEQLPKNLRAPIKKLLSESIRQRPTAQGVLHEEDGYFVRADAGEPV